MTLSPRLYRFATVFGSAFAVCYAAAVKLDIALFTVYPSLRIVLWGTHHSHDVVDPALGFAAPDMLWYGWFSTAALAALPFGLAAACLPVKWTGKFLRDLAWLLPLAAMLACVYFSLIWFRL